MRKRHKNNSDKEPSHVPKDEDLREKLEKQIILADSHLCVALLNFLQQDFNSSFKGAWVLLKAWKVYQDSYAQISSLYEKTFGCSAPVQGGQKTTVENVRKSISSINVGASSSSATLNKTYSVPNTPDDTSARLFSSVDNPSAVDYGNTKFDIDPDIVARLMAAVSFGYGYEVSREVGLSALMFCREGDDMRAPLASLALLWYHTMVRPFFAIDGFNVQAGVSEAELLINESQEEFGESALFLFFKGRVERLKSNIPESLKAYENAYDKSNQREIQLLCLHEIGWCYLILLDWQNAYHCFNKLRIRSKWSQSFYTYLHMVCLGALGDTGAIPQIAEKLQILLNKENGVSQVKSFVSRRLKKFQSPDLPEKFSCVLFLLELLYFWNALPSCNPSDLKLILEDCKPPESELIPGLYDLIEGAVYLCTMESEKAVASFKACLEKRNAIRTNTTDPDDNYDHIPAFASFELAAILAQNPETLEEGKRLLLLTQTEYKEYDFQYRLTISINSLLKKLRKSS